MCLLVWHAYHHSMGMMTENAILTQSKKAQGETNQRLDAIRVLLEQQNALLQQLLGALRPAA